VTTDVIGLNANRRRASEDFTAGSPPPAGGLGGALGRAAGLDGRTRHRSHARGVVGDLRGPGGSRLETVVLIDADHRQWVAEAVADEERRELYRGPSPLLAKAAAGRQLYDAMPPYEDPAGPGIATRGSASTRLRAGSSSSSDNGSPDAGRVTSVYQETLK
jgi:hypothetical protein